MTKGKDVFKGKSVFASLIVFTLLLVSCVMAADVAYIYDKSFKIDNNAINAFNELGLSVNTIQIDSITNSDFSNYRLVFIGDERFDDPDLIWQRALENNPSVISNYYHGRDWGLVNNQISQLGGTSPLKVLYPDGSNVQVYTQAFYSQGSTVAIPYYYLANTSEQNWIAPGLRKAVGTYIPRQQQGNYDIGAVIAYGDKGSRLYDTYSNGQWTYKTLNKKMCFYGIDTYQNAKFSSNYWTEEAKQMFKDCVAFTLVECENDDECGDSGFTGNLFCSGTNVTRNYTTYTCNNPGTISSHCTSTTTSILNKTCGDNIFCNGQETCSNGNCVSGTNPCSGFDIPLVNTCFNVPENINQTFDYRPAFTSCDEASDICKQGDSTITHTCNLTCGADLQCNGLNPGTGRCDANCKYITCFNNGECGVDGFTGSLFCSNNFNLSQNYTTYTCNNAGTSLSSCSSLVTALLNQTCQYGCLNGACLGLHDVGISLNFADSVQGIKLSNSSSSIILNNPAIFVKNKKYNIAFNLTNNGDYIENVSIKGSGCGGISLDYVENLFAPGNSVVKGPYLKNASCNVGYYNLTINANLTTATDYNPSDNTRTRQFLVVNCINDFDCNSGYLCVNGSTISSICVPSCVDNDDDGYNATVGCGPIDCNDTNDNIHPNNIDAVCNGIDNDCDNSIDEDYIITNTNCGIGQCANSGQLICVNGTEQNTCHAGTPITELCNGLDDNCNNLVDDGIANITNGTDVGECQQEIQSCINGGFVIVQPGINPIPEFCDNKDNDCDGQVDESLTRACSNACFSGTETCSLGSWIGCTAQLPPINFNQSCSAGIGACLRTGTINCSGNCNAVPGNSSQEICYNGIDDDCDSFTDMNDIDCQECQNDDDCEDSHEDTEKFCDGNVISNRTLFSDFSCVFHKCVKNNTEIITPIEDCRARDGITGCGEYEWSCSEEINDVHCVITDIIPRNDLCSNSCSGDILNAGFCNITTYQCYNISQNCNIQDDNFCSGNLLFENDYTCNSQTLTCTNQTSIIENCANRNQQYCGSSTSLVNETWTCSNKQCTANTSVLNCLSLGVPYNFPLISNCTNNPDANPLTFDYRAAFASTCNNATKTCTQGNPGINHTCNMLTCGAGCDATHECDRNACSSTYSDQCDGRLLVDYNNNGILDSITIEDLCSNTCLGDCSCTSCQPNCTAPAPSEYCSELCGADHECDGLLAGTGNCDEECNFIEYECDEDIDCGTSGFIGEEYCFGDGIFQDYLSFTCINPGQENSDCINETTRIFIRSQNVTSVSYCDNVALRATNFDDNLNLYKFNPEFGSLIGVKLNVSAFMVANISAENTGISSGQINVTVVSNATLLTLENSDLIVNILLKKSWQNVSAYDGTTDFAGASGRSDSISGSNSLLFSGNLDNYIASHTGEMFNLPIRFTARSYFTGPGNLATSFSSLGSADACVEYVYSECASEECDEDSDCGQANSYLECSGDDLMNITINPICSFGNCGNSQSENLVEHCSNGCEDARCTEECIDNDNDGYNSTSGCGVIDCDDNNEDVNPGIAELCDSIDNNCDGNINEGNVCGGLCKIVYKIGNQDSGVQVDCPSGYSITGGGFVDKSSSYDDQDWSIPKDNGWYCREDHSSDNSKCYAVCCNSQLIETKNKVIVMSQNNGVFVPCDSGFSILGGGFSDKGENTNDQDANRPKDNGWYCREGQSPSDAECHGICGKAKIGNIQCITAEKMGNQNFGISVHCPDGYFVTGGGFGGEYSNEDDEDYSKPISNGWYCRENNSNLFAKCYARCCKIN